MITDFKERSLEQLSGLSVIVPVYNEEESVVSLYHEIVEALQARQFAFEIIFVDDGSTDNTSQRLYTLSMNDARLRVIRHRSNCGQSAALITGGKAAVYPYLVTLDGDGQNDPADIPLLFRLIKDERTIILGNRSRRNDSILKRISSWVGNNIRQIFLKDQCPDTGCSLKIFPKQAFIDLPHFNHLHRFLPALFLRAGYTLINVPVNHRPRRFGVSKYGVLNRLFVGIYDLFGVQWLLKRPCTPEIVKDE